MGLLIISFETCCCKVSTAPFVADEIAQHVNFCYLKCSNFYGRHEELAAVQKLMLSGSGAEGSVVVLYGVSGVGKTAMMAQLIHNFSTLFEGQPDCVCVCRFVGISDRSSSLSDILRSICEQVVRRSEPSRPAPFTRPLLHVLSFCFLFL